MKILPIGRGRKILLSGVFGPFGVDDAFGRKENIMELFHNQVTRGQGLASFRFHHRSFGLYFLAENIDAEVTVLDFPSRQKFEEEAAKGYDIVGISFIAPNMVKAREMARIVRKTSPETIIIVGGHGTAIEDVEQLIDCDHVVRGEGIRWLRRFLGQDPEAPIVHPVLPSYERASIFGVPLPGRPANLLVPGVGCVNACKFCCTSHFFGRKYTHFLSTGKQLFETACRIADRLGRDEFFVMDENFLKDKTRALQLMDEMERHGRFFKFHLFSSAETITDFGLDNLERLGVTFVWIGVESSSEIGNFAKNKGIDPGQLIKALRDRGIIVLASGILCMEHHTPENIGHEIDFMVGLKADFVQFMLLTPLPVTQLYRDHRDRGLLRDDLPYEEWHGQKMLSYRHPLFPGDSAARWVDTAFRRDYEENSSSLCRVIDTILRGYRRLGSLGRLDPCLAERRRGLERHIRLWSMMLPHIMRNAVNETERRRARRLRDEIRGLFPDSLADGARRLAVRVLGDAWKLRVSIFGDVIQPATITTKYPAGRRLAAPVIPLSCPAESPAERVEDLVQSMVH